MNVCSWGADAIFRDRRSIPTTDNLKIQRLREGYQPKQDEVTKGYRVTQPVDLNNLRVPKNLGDAAVTPQSGGSPTPVPAKNE